MAENGYKQLITYQLADRAFVLGWEIVPLYYSKYEDHRQRDQIKQALRSGKQNIVEGSAERSLSTKLKLYDVAKSSIMEALEDFEDILKLEHLPHWDRYRSELSKLHQQFEHQSNPSNPSNSSPLSIPLILQCCGIARRKGGLEELGGIEGLEILINYQIDLLIRCGYLLDKQINAVEHRHQTQGGYNENLLKRRLIYKNSHF